MACVSVPKLAKRKMASSGLSAPKRQEREETVANPTPRARGTPLVVPPSDRELRSSNKKRKQQQRKENGADSKLPTRDVPPNPLTSNGEQSSSDSEPGASTKPDPERLARISGMQNAFFRTALSPENLLADTCTLCNQKPPTSGEEWCILACGHSFGHRCLRDLFLYPSFRGCPTCVKPKPSLSTCCHPVEPAMLSSVDELHGVYRMRALKRAVRLIDAQTRSVCRYCEEQPEVDELAFLLLDMRYGESEKPEHRERQHRWEPEWQEWWKRETAKIPLTVKTEQDLLRTFKFNWGWSRPQRN